LLNNRSYERRVHISLEHGPNNKNTLIVEYLEGTNDIEEGVKGFRESSGIIAILQTFYDN
jgi:hypothetical protein